MATRYDLEDWVVEALQALGGSATVLDVCQQVWQRHEHDLRASGSLFYTWQYDIRWAAHRLRRRRLLLPSQTSPQGVWELAG
jgi:hypothetical protein